MLDYIDELLKTDQRAATYDPEQIMCGAAGNRVYGSFGLQPGICGSFHFVHKSDFRDPLKLHFQGLICPVKLKTVYEWRPSHLYLKHFYACFEITERKYITADDLVVSQTTIKSVSGGIRFRLSLQSDLLENNFEAARERFQRQILLKAFSSANELFTGQEIDLPEGAEFHFTIACGFKVRGEEWPAPIPTLAQHRRQFGRFFEGIPKLSCSDPDIEKIYYYRWYLLRHHLADPQLGNIRHPIFYEGRYGYFNEPEANPADVVGWEFSRGILASAALHLLELKWHHNRSLAEGGILNFTDNFGVMEPFLGYVYDVPLLPGCVRIHDLGGHYFFHLLPYAAWQIYALTRDQAWLRRVEPVLWQDLTNWGRYDRENCCLPEMIYEGDSAMEFGPASHYHQTAPDAEPNPAAADLTVGLPCNYEAENGKWGAPVSNRRTEVAAFYGLNYYAFAKIYQSLGDDHQAAVCRQKYQRIKAAVTRYMWNDQESFFMELTADLQQIEAVKQIGGIFSLWLVDPKDGAGFLENLSRSDRFRQKYGIATTSKDSFGYSPNNTVNGIRAHTCMWNGPTWPYSTSLALLSVGSYLKRIRAPDLKNKYLQYFKEEFLKYTRLHFLYGDKARPCIVEHYNGDTGQPLSNQDDYNHSCYIDILVRMVCGLDLTEEGTVNFSPLNLGIEYLKLEQIYCHGSYYSIEIDKKQARLFKEEELMQTISLE